MLSHNAARYLPEFDPGLFEFLKRPDKLTIVEFPISTELWRGHKLRRVQGVASPCIWEGPAAGKSSLPPYERFPTASFPARRTCRGLSVVIQGFGNAGASRDPEVVDKPLRRRSSPAAPVVGGPLHGCWCSERSADSYGGRACTRRT